MKKPVLFPLGVIAAAFVLLLGLSFGLHGAGSAKAQAEHERIMRTILPGSEAFVLETYSGEDANIRSIHKADNGYVVETVTAGYAGDIRMMVGVSNEGTVTGLVVLDMEETYGLGANALTDHKFLSQMLNTSGEAEVGTNVDAISGATVTSKAVVRSVNSAVAFVTGADVGSAATSWGG